MVTTLFLDSMMFMHYRRLQDIDFATLCHSETIEIIIPRITVRELDKHKNTHPSTKIRKRVAGVLQSLEQWIQNNEAFRTNTTIRYYASIPSNSFMDEHDLNPAWSDDILLATILQFIEENPDAAITLITQDSGPRLTAYDLNIPVMSLPDEYKLPVEPDPIEAENRTLKRELLKLQNMRPKLIIGLVNDETPESFAKFKLPPSPVVPQKDDISQKITQLKHTYPKKFPPSSPSSTSKHQFDALQTAITAAFGSMLPIPEEEYERYNNEVEQFWHNYERYLHNLHDYEGMKTRMIHFQIEIANIGNAPAEDVDVWMYFPDGFHMFTEKNFPVPPKEPCPPQKPRSPLDKLIQMNIGGSAEIPRIDKVIPSTIHPLNSRSISAFELKKTVVGQNR